MTLLTAEKLARRFDDQIVLDQVSFAVNSGDKIGLLGRNGCGKTTLFEIIAGKHETDAGAVHRSRDCKIDYAEQELGEYLGLTLNEYVSQGRPDILEMRAKISSAEHQLEITPHDRELLEELGSLQEKYQISGGFEFDHQVDTILQGLGFIPERHSERLQNFSGGEKNRASLARILAGNGSLMLLDEPTNHLDIESTQWLEEFLAGTNRAYIVVSHDRMFMSRVVRDVWELLHGKIEFYTGGIDRYFEERTERRRLHEHRYRHQQEHIRKVEEFIRRNMAGQKTRQAQSRLKYLSRIKRLPPPKVDEQAAKIQMASSGRSYAHILSLNDVALGYGDRIVLNDVNVDIYRGEKVGLIGRNGSGKTTLLKSLIGELSPAGGEICLGNKVDVAYFDQELTDLDPDLTVLDSIWEVDPMADGSKMRAFLARFGFTGDEPFKPVRALSGGEKTKLSLARLLYHPANFIIFDEPTNHLDMDSREALEAALIEYEGSCLIVSHDRHFLDRVVNRILHIDGGALRQYDGNYSYYMEKTRPTETATIKPVKSKEAYLSFKELSKARGRLKKDIKAAQEKIVELEAELTRLERDIEYDLPRNDWEALQAASIRKEEVEYELLGTYARLDELEETDLG
ncbi:MAG TPA: ABC-F family ATP-binding cassette domain-containing protein [candidate division Zixibacteria bacterium]|nr:ABC-F family ATP-binding cassette domain-containing protein [candidate division Zixibacteria bacterium]